MGEVFIVENSNRQSYISGNTVVSPEYNPSKKYNDEKYKKLQKAKKEAQSKMRKQQTKQKLVVIRMISFVFVIGIILLLRYVAIYKMQANLLSYKTEISNYKAQNESLRLILAKNGNIKAVEETAINNLHMVRPSASQVMMVDLSKENFNKVKVNTMPTSMLEKLKHILF